MTAPHVSTATPGRRRAAARLLFADAPPADRDPRADALLRAVADGRVDPVGLIVADRGGGGLIGAMLVQLLPGRGAVVVPPVVLPGEADAADALARRAGELLDERGVRVAQVFIEPGFRREFAPLLRHGFRHVTRVDAFTRPGQLDVPPPPPGVHFAPAAEDWPAFADTLADTYADSFDVPEAFAGRTPADLLAGYRDGQPDPPHWWLARDAAANPVGVVLLSAVGEHVWEIGYLGVLPERRGRGVGAALAAHAARAAAAVGAAELQVAADVRNEPAVRLYRRLGFRHDRTLDVLLRTAP